MSKFKIDILRRIENFSSTLGIKPKVGKVNENHVEDDWENERIYKGEIFFNLVDNKIFTSNGREILHLNTPKNYVLNGLEVQKPPTAGEGIGLDLRINSGYAVIDGKLCKHVSESVVNPDVSDYQISLSGVPAIENKIVLLFAKQVELLPGQVQTTDEFDIGFVQHIITGSNAISNFEQLNLKHLPGDILYNLLYQDPSVNGLLPFMNKKHMLVSIIFVPSNYNISSYNILEPISLSNNCSSFPLQEKSAKDLLCDRLNTITTWDAEKVFYKSQIIRDKNNLYMVHKTFGNGIYSNIKDFLIPDYLEPDPVDPSECECECECEDESLTLNNFLSIINVDYRDPANRLDGKTFWIKVQPTVFKTEDPNFYKYIIGIVPNLDPIEASNVSTVDLPEVAINGVRFTVGYNNQNKDSAHIYFAEESSYQTFNPIDFTPAELESLQFAGRNISEGMYIIWNQEMVGYEYDMDKMDIVLHYKI